MVRERLRNINFVARKLYGEDQLTLVREGGNVAHGHIKENIFSYFLNESHSFPSQVYSKGHFFCCLGKLMFPRESQLVLPKEGDNVA
jgi:hypothetical protein